MSSVLLPDLSQEQAKRLPRYPAVPVARFGRLAVDEQWVGGAFLWDAIERADGAEITAYALLVDAKDDNAAAFYRHHGVLTLGSGQRTLFLPLASAVSREGTLVRSAHLGARRAVFCYCSV